VLPEISLKLNMTDLHSKYLLLKFSHCRSRFVCIITFSRMCAK